MLKKIAKRGLFFASRKISDVLYEQSLNRKCLQAEKRLELHLPELYATMKKQKDEGGFYSKIYPLKLIEIWDYVNLHKPKTILELGSGATSTVFAKYALQNKDVKYTSIDENAVYLKSAMEKVRMNVGSLPENATFLNFDRVDGKYAGKDVSYYNDGYFKLFENKHIDLVYVDGPSNQSPVNKNIFFPCIDSNRLLDDGFFIKTFMFDYRISSVKFLLENAPMIFHYQLKINKGLFSYSEVPWVITQEAFHHSILTRNW